MQKSIMGFNAAAKQGKSVAQKYCQAWQSELTVAGAELAAELVGKKIDKATYNRKREALNKQMKDLNECIQAVNRS